MAYERLTERDETGMAYVKNEISSATPQQDALDRLAEFEDIGLSPEEIKVKLAELEKYKSIGTVEQFATLLIDELHREYVKLQ